MGDCMEKGPFANKDDYLFKMMIFYLAMHEYQRLAGFAAAEWDAKETFTDLVMN